MKALIKEIIKNKSINNQNNIYNYKHPQHQKISNMFINAQIFKSKKLNGALKKDHL